MFATITLGEGFAFMIGLMCVYFLARFCRILAVLLCLLPLCGHAQTTNIAQVVTEVSQVDYQPAFVAGFGVGLSMLGFGWILRLVFKIPSGGSNSEY